MSDLVFTTSLWPCSTWISVGEKGLTSDCIKKKYTYRKRITRWRYFHLNFTCIPCISFFCHIQWTKTYTYIYRYLSNLTPIDTNINIYIPSTCILRYVCLYIYVQITYVTLKRSSILSSSTIGFNGYIDGILSVIIIRFYGLRKRMKFRRCVWWSVDSHVTHTHTLIHFA